jgi:hypothetical protein
MNRLVLGVALCVLAGTVSVAAASQDRDDRHDRDEHHDNGKHKGQEKQEDGGDRHDNGKHKGWEKQEPRADYRAWDHDHDRIVPGKHYPRGRYEHVKQVYVARSIDYRTRNVVLYDRSNWVVASYDLNRCRDWQFDRDQVYVYDDDHHPGWYLLFNARLGRYVHVEYSGIR